MNDISIATAILAGAITGIIFSVFRLAFWYGGYSVRNENKTWVKIIDKVLNIGFYSVLFVGVFYFVLQIFIGIE